MPVEPIRTGHFATPLSLSPTREQREILFVKKSAGGGMSGGQGGKPPLKIFDPNEAGPAEASEATPEVNTRIQAEVEQVRNRLRNALGDIIDTAVSSDLPDVKFSELEVFTLTGAKKHVDSLHDHIEGHLGSALSEALSINTDEADRKVLEAKSALQNLERCGKFLRTISGRSVQYSNALPAGVNALYDPARQQFILRDEFAAPTQIDRRRALILHEGSHAVLDALHEIGIDTNYFRTVRESLARTETREFDCDDGTKSAMEFSRLLDFVRRHGQPYQAYGRDTADMNLIMEELLVRYSEWKRDPSQVHDTTEYELEAFRLLDVNGEKLLLKKVSDGGMRNQSQRYNAGRSASGAAPEGGSTVDSSKRILDEISETEKRIQDIIDKTSGAEAEIRKIMATDPGKRDEHLMNISEEAKAFSDKLQTLRQYKGWVMQLSQWKSGKMPPSAYAQFIHGVAFSTETVSSVEAMVLERIGTPTWDHLDGPGRQNVASNKFKEIEEAIMKSIEDTCTALQTVSDQAKIKFEEIKATANRAEVPGGFIPGVSFYSIKEIGDAIKNVWDSFQESIKEWQQLRTATLSNTLGGLTASLPFGDRAKLSLEKSIDHKDQEVAHGFQEHLKHDNASFMDMVGHHDLLQKSSNDANRFRGSLEYMAEKGWLYEFDYKSGLLFASDARPTHRYNVNDYLPAWWNDGRKAEYLRDLHQKNQSGGISEQSRGKDRVKDMPDIPPMMEILDDEMQRANYWAVFGIVERIIEKAKLGESSAWVCSRIFAHMRRTDEGGRFARRYFPKGLMDKLGNLGLPNPAWLTSFMKLDRHAIERWQQGGHDDFSRAGRLPKTIATIEAKIKKAYKDAGKLDEFEKLEKSKTTDNLDRKVSQVLATQEINVCGSVISIFDDDPVFKDYRDHIGGSSLNPKDCDDDFYNPANDGSEVVLQHAGGYATILAVNTTGDLINDTKAKMFLEQLILRNERLGKLKKDSGNGKPLEKFMEETTEKMRRTVLGVWTHGNNNKLIKQLDDPPNNKNTIVDLLHCGVISVATMAESIDKKIPFGTGVADYLFDQQEAIHKMRGDDKTGAEQAKVVAEYEQKPKATRDFHDRILAVYESLKKSVNKSAGAKLLETKATSEKRIKELEKTIAKYERDIIRLNIDIADVSKASMKPSNEAERDHLQEEIEAARNEIDAAQKSIRKITGSLGEAA